MTRRQYTAKKKKKKGGPNLLSRGHQGRGGDNISKRHSGGKSLGGN